MTVREANAADPTTRTALVVGASGITGSALVDLLLEQGWEVLALSRGGSSRSGVGSIAADLRDAESLLLAQAGLTRFVLTPVLVPPSAPVPSVPSVPVGRPHQALGLARVHLVDDDEVDLRAEEARTGSWPDLPLVRRARGPGRARRPGRCGLGS